LGKAIRDIFIPVVVSGSTPRVIDLAKQGFVINWAIYKAKAGTIVVNDGSLIPTNVVVSITNNTNSAHLIRNISTLKIQGDGEAIVILSTLVDDEGIGDS